MLDYVIVGAGFAGCVCAERLASAGKRVVIVERRNHIGGNAYDHYDDAGILVHRYGAHCFHTNSRDVFDYLSQFTEWRPYEHRVLSHTSRGLLPVPINQTTLAAFDGDLDAAQLEMIAPYTRKQWGPYADRLLPSVLARVAPRGGWDDRYVTDVYQAMPTHGYTRMFERMLAHPNIAIMLQTSYQHALETFNEYLDPCGEYCGSQTIYTGSIDEFFGYEDGRLPYRSATFHHGTHNGNPAQRVGVVNYPNEGKSCTRCIEWKHLTGQQHPQTTVTYEQPRECSASDEPLWPVPTVEGAALYRTYQARAEQISRVYFVGRLGTYAYLNMDQVVAQALELSRQLLAA